MENFRMSFIQKRESVANEQSDFYTLLHVLQIMLVEL
jgi:hypothetical protein